MKKMFKYMALYREIKDSIEQGILKPGDKLPAENILMQKGYSRNTVRQALALLEEEGIIVKRRGSGSIVKPLLGGREQNGTVALIFTDFDTYVFNDTLQGITDGLYGWATPLLYSSKAKIEEEERILKELLEKKPDGVIVQAFNTALPNPNIPLYQKLQDNGIPLVFLYSYYEELNNILYVTNDDEKGAADVVKYLYEQGRRNFSSIFVTEMRQFHHRFSGYQRECHHLDIRLKSDNILWVSVKDLRNQEELKGRFRKLVAECDAVVCASDIYAALIIEVLLEMGKRVPEDVSVISFDNSILCDYTTVPLTSMDCGAYKIGLTAARKLKHILAGRKENSVSLSWNLVKRKSC